MTKSEAYIVLQKLRQLQGADYYTTKACQECDQVHVMQYWFTASTVPSNLQLVELPCGHKIMADIEHEDIRFVKAAETQQDTLHISFIDRHAA